MLAALLRSSSHALGRAALRCGAPTAAAAAPAMAAALQQRDAGLHWSAAAGAAEPSPAAAAAATPGTVDFDLTEEQQQFQHVAEEFAREELAPFRWGGRLRGVAGVADRQRRKSRMADAGPCLHPRAARSGTRSTTSPSPR